MLEGLKDSPNMESHLWSWLEQHLVTFTLEYHDCISWNWFAFTVYTQPFPPHLVLMFILRSVKHRDSGWSERFKGSTECDLSLTWIPFEFHCELRPFEDALFVFKHTVGGEAGAQRSMLLTETKPSRKRGITSLISPPHTHTHIPYISCSKIVNGFSCPSVTAGYRCWYLVMEFNRKTIMLVAVGVNQTSQPYSGFPLSFITAEDWLNMHCVWQMAVIGLLGTFHGSTIWSISLLPSLSGKALKMNNGVGYRRWQTLCRFNFSV